MTVLLSFPAEAPYRVDQVTNNPGLMLTLARTGRIDKLSKGLCRSDDYEAVKARMARFMAAGIREICENPGERPPADG